MKLRPLHRLMFATAATALAAIGCAPVDSEPESGEGDSETGEPQAGGTLTVGWYSAIGSIDGHAGGQSKDLFRSAVYETLIRLDENLEPQPQLAESWELADDATSLRFSLRAGVTFHDGKPFTAEDAKYSIERVRDPEVGAGGQARFSNLITNIEVVDDLTLELTFERPMLNIFDVFELLYIVDKDTVEGPNAATTANGTGPFMLESWSQGSSLTLARNPDYWDEGKPYLDEIDMQIVPDPATRVVQLQSGDVDAAALVSRLDIEDLEAAEYTVTVADPVGSFYIALDTTDPVLADPAVRYALNHAIDRDRFVEQTLHGVGDPTVLPWAPSSPAYDEELNSSVSFDLDEARRLLDEAGAGEFDTTLSVFGGSPELVDFAQIVKSDFAEIGVDVTIDVVEPAGFGDAVQDYTGMLSAPFASANYSPGSLFMLARPFRVDDNISRFTDPEYARLVDAVLTAADPDAHAQAMRELDEFFIEQSFVMPIGTDRQTFAASTDVHGWGERRVNAGFRIADVWIEQ